MKKITLLIILLAFSFFSKAQQMLSKEQHLVQHNVINMFDALSIRDSLKLKNYCATDINFYEYGEIWNLDTLISKAITQNTATDFKRINTFNFINTTTDKNSAWLTYKLRSLIIKEGKQVNIEWLETVILAKQKKHWKVKHLHSTLIKKS